MTERIVGPRLPELKALAIDFTLRARMKRKSNGPVSERGLRKQAEAFRIAMEKGSTIPPHVSVTETQIAGCVAEWVRVGDGSDPKVVLYFHGGGFFMSSSRLHRPLTWR